MVYLIIGITWMGPGSFFIPGPSGNAGAAFDTARFHLVFVGAVGFTLLGLIYYVAPRLGKRELHSTRLGNVHFWLSMIVFPIAVVIEAATTVAYQDLLNSPTFSMTDVPGALIGLLVLVIALFSIGIGAQVVFAYNIYKTMRRE